MTDIPRERRTRGRARSNRTPEQRKERQGEQMRRYAVATNQAHRRLKQEHEDEFFEYLDEELVKVYTERGPLPYES